MSAFTAPLTLTQLGGGDWRRWRLEQALRYEVAALGSGRVIEVPVGFVTDGASVPRWLWAVLPAWGRYSRAASIHDYLLDCLKRGAPHAEAPDRRAADAIFHAAMLDSSVNRQVAFVMWLAVRATGMLKREKP